MVSRLDHDERTLPIRRPPSVSSRSSATTRRHNRHHRSHVGGSSYQPQNEFPVFAHTGDIEIVIASERREQKYLLHRLILAQCSGFFDAGTSEEWSRGQHENSGSAAATVGLASIPEATAASAQRKRWRYEIDWGNKKEDVPTLIQADPSSSSLFGGDYHPRSPMSRSKPTAVQSSFFRSMANFSAVNVNTSVEDDPEDDVFRDYDNLFRVFYNYPPALDPVSVANAYVECKSLLHLADMYDALEVIGPRIDHHLLRFQGRLWKQIAKYPPSYLKLANLARSRAIFTEALIHVVGQWPQGENQLRGKISEQVLELIEDKVAELEELKSKIEVKLFRLTLTTSRGERVTPHNAYLDWMTMSLFRQWFAERTTPSPAPILKESSRTGGNSCEGGGGGADAGAGGSNSSAIGRVDRRAAQPGLSNAVAPNIGRVFRKLGAGGDAYLTRDELKKFLKLRPEEYSRENLRRFERRLDDLKNLAKEAVRPLMRNFLELDLGRDGGGLPYFTCTKLMDEDYPWDE